MDAKRLIPILRVLDAQVVMPDDAGGWRGSGRPADLAARLELEGADAILFQESRGPGVGGSWIREVAGALFIPFALEAPFGGMRELDEALEAGADQVILAADAAPALLAGAAARFGRAHVGVAAALAHNGLQWQVDPAGAGTGPEALAWVDEQYGQGAGAVLLDNLAGHAALAELLQGAARSPLAVLAHGSGDAAEAAEILLQGADGVAFPAHACVTAALKAALSGYGLTLRM
jgi:cyclase